MSRSALHGIGQVIKANTTEKSIEQLRLEGKKRVRVVSSEKVMAIIQAIVDDAINAEVGEITQRDRDRVVRDTQERFSRVLRMQQDLEQSVDDLRGSLRGAEIERDRLRTDKALLEARLESVRLDAARRPAADTGAARRTGEEFDELRLRLDAIGRDTVAACGVAAETALVRVEEKQAGLDTLLAARLEHGFRTMTDQVTKSLADAARSRAAADAASRTASAAAADDGAAQSAVAEALAELRADTEQAAARAATAAARMAEFQTSLASRLEGSLADLRGDLSANATRAVEEVARVAEVQASLASRLDGSLTDLHGDLSANAARGAEAAARMAELQASLASRLDGSLADLRGDLSANATRAVEEVARLAEVQASLAGRLDGSLADLRSEMAANAARSADAAERQAEAVRMLREQVARAAVSQSESLQTSFKDSLENALDKITRTMERATARPIEMTAEATEVLLAKIFDSPDSEMTSNLDQLDVAQRRTNGSIAKSVGRLNAMRAPVKAGVPRPV